MFSNAVAKQKILFRTRYIKTAITFFLDNFLLKLSRMLHNRCSNHFFDFYFFPIFRIGAINFQSLKTTKAPLF